MTDIEVETLELLERKYHESSIAEGRAWLTLSAAQEAYDETYRKRADASAALRKYREQCKQNDA